MQSRLAGSDSRTEKLAAMVRPLLAGAAAVGALAIGVGGYAVADQLGGTSTTLATTTAAMGCNDWPVTMTLGECQSAGIIRYVALYNLQGAAQFCKWKAANPGEWSRLKTAAQSGERPTSIATWLGASIGNMLEAYDVTGAPPFTIAPNTAPNACGGKLVAPPAVGGVTPGQTSATVTISTS